MKKLILITITSLLAINVWGQWSTETNGIYYTDGNVGIGTNSTSTNTLNIGKNTMKHQLYSGLTLTNPISGSTGIWINMYPLFTGDESVAEQFSTAQFFNFPIINTGHTNTSNMIGSYSRVFRNASSSSSDDNGTLTNIMSGYFQYGNYNSNTTANPQTTNAFGLYIAPYCKTGTITNMYDIYLSAESTGGTVTNAYGIYQANTKKNYFAGNVGIGKSPSVKLDVLGQDINFFSGTTTNTFKIGRNDNENFKFYVTDNNGYLDYIQDSDDESTHVFYIRNLAEGSSINNDIRFQTSSIDRLTIRANGNVGIGTTAPSTKFEVLSGVSNNEIARFGGTVTGRGLRISSFMVGGTNEVGFDFNAPGAGGAAAITFSTLNIERVRINYNGNVGIGTTAPIYKLSVKGTIGCGEVKVEDVTTWADFVFEPEYNLMSLKDLETFIKANKHLPEIPTTTEVKENGIAVGEMNAKLLQKIEELTLYVIELQKKNEEQDIIINKLENK